MSFRKIVPVEPESPPELVEAIAEELRLRRPDGPEDAPQIVEENLLRSDYVHVTVVWDRWDGVGLEVRGRVIMDAYKKARGIDEVLKISVALGLTHREADRLGVTSRWAPSTQRQPESSYVLQEIEQGTTKWL